MTPKQAIDTLTKANEWRRGAEIEQPNHKQLGEAIDLAIQVMSQL